MNKRENIQNFVKYVLNELAVARDAKLTTLKMQFSFVCNLENAYRDVEKFRIKLLDRLSPLMLDICKWNQVFDRSDILVLYRKITFYVTFLTGLGSPTMEPVYVEALTALKSIMDENDLREFVAKESTVKEQELHYLAKIVSGIRLFNKDCDKGGVGIPNLYSLLLAAIAVLKDETQEILNNVMEIVETITVFLDGHFLVEPDIFDNSFKLEPIITPDITIETLEQTKDLLILFRQYELFVRKILVETDRVDVACRHIYDEFDDLLRDIHRAAQYKIAVSVNVIFPMFEALSDHWTKLQNQVIILGVYNKILTYLADYSKTAHSTKAFWDLTMPKLSISEPRPGSEKRIVPLNKAVLMYRAESLHLNRIKFRYLGFCPWVLVKTEGVLIPGNLDIGVARYKYMYYVFSCSEAAVEFTKNPDECIMHILDLARKKPQLIHFLDLRDELLDVFCCPQLVKEKVIETKTESTEVQTSNSYDEVEPPGEFVKYFWNVWDLKRKALQLSDTSKCFTAATQTDKTHSKNTRGTQTYRRKDEETQTKKDNYDNVPTPHTFIYGLRGRTDKNQFVMNITAPVE